MNQTIRSSGGKSAAPSRSARVFRRSLTPTLALLAAMALGLVVPTAAGAQHDLTLRGGGGGGGGGQGNSNSDGVGGDGGPGGNSGSQGATGTNTAAGGGGTGGDATVADTGQHGYNSYTAGAIPEANDKVGGAGGSVTHTDYVSATYDTITLSAGTGGDGGKNGTGTPVAGGAAGNGGTGGSVSFVGAANVVTTITGNLSVTSGSAGALANGASAGYGGAASINHQGTMLFNNSISQILTFSSGTGTRRGLVNVYINNLRVDGTQSGGDVTIDTSGLSANNRVLFNTLSMTNGGQFVAGSNSDWGTTDGFTFNNLYVYGYGNTVNLDSGTNYAYKPGIVNGALYFEIGNDTRASSNPMVTFGEVNGGDKGLNLTGFNPNNLVIVGEQNYYRALTEGQKIILVRGVDDPGAFTSPFRTTIYKGGLRFEDFFIRTNLSDLEAIYGGKAQSVRTGEAFSPYFQGQMAALYTVSGGSRPVLERASRALVDTPTSVGEPLISLYATGSEITLNTGSSVDVESYGGVLAVGTKFNNTAGLTTVAAFGEFGTGSYDTFKKIPDLYAYNNGKLIGSGDTDYAGGGVFFHHLFDANHFAGGFSLEGSFRMGSVKNEFNLDILDRTGYDIDRNYWGGHLGLGYNYLLTNMDSIDMFGQLHMAYVENGTVQTSAGERLHFLAAKSTVSRLGGRYNHNFNELLKGYATAAWEYEFEGDVGGSVDRTRIQKAPNIEGSSGFGQLGLNVKSASNPVSLDLSVFGVTGQQEGYGGTIGLKLDF